MSLRFGFALASHLMRVNKFSCTCWPSLDLLGRNLCVHLWPRFSSACAFSRGDVCVDCIFGLLTPCPMCVLQISTPSCCAVFALSRWFPCLGRSGCKIGRANVCTP